MTRDPVVDDKAVAVDGFATDRGLGEDERWTEPPRVHERPWMPPRCPPQKARKRRQNPADVHR